MGDTSKRIK